MIPFYKNVYTCLKLNIQKTTITASGPITSWQIDGETKKTVRDFILGGSKITADGDHSHEIKRHLLLGRKAMTNLDSILKSRDSVQLSSIAQSCLTLCNPMDHSMPGLPVYHQLLELKNSFHQEELSCYEGSCNLISRNVHVADEGYILSL